MLEFFFSGTLCVPRFVMPFLHGFGSSLLKQVICQLWSTLPFKVNWFAPFTRNGSSTGFWRYSLKPNISLVGLRAVGVPGGVGTAGTK